MKKIETIDVTCTACGACASICPKGCISMIENIDGFYYPSIDTSLCVDCNLCETTCHIIAPYEEKNVTLDNFYMYWQSDESKRQSSTSGGAFLLFAQYVLDRGGAVFGSMYNGDKERLEVRSSDDCGLEPLKKSKYVESFVDKSFKVIRKELQEGRYVLYCGTPCQAARLRKYLGVTKTNQDRFILIDFACHGVPTNKMLTHFKRKFETKTKKITNIEFRYKDYKDSKSLWHTVTMKLYFSNGKSKVIHSNSYYYYYYKTFVESVNLRRSCYNCFQVEHSEADITVGDFWDIIKYKPELDDNKGVSFIKFHNDKWKDVLQAINPNDFLQELPKGTVVDPYKKKSKLPKLPERERYLSLLRKYGCYAGSRKYFGTFTIFRNTYFSQFKNLLKPILYKTIWRNRTR